MPLKKGSRCLYRPSIKIKQKTKQCIMQFQKGKIEESKIGNYMGERKTFTLFGQVTKSNTY